MIGSINKKIISSESEKDGWTRSEVLRKIAVSKGKRNGLTTVTRDILSNKAGIICHQVNCMGVMGSGLAKAIKDKYNPLIKQYHLNPVTIPARPSAFCDKARSIEITEELMQSEAELLILLGDIPIAQYLQKVADIPYSTLGEYVDMYGYGTKTEAIINGKTIQVLPLAHPRQIGALGAHSEKWFLAHKEWEQGNKMRL